MKKCRKMLSMLLAITVLLSNLVLVGTVSAATVDYEVKETPLNDNFNSYTKFAGTTDSGDMSVAGYGKHVYGSNYAALETIDGDQALKLASGCDTVQYTLNEALTAGLVRISYSGRFDSSALIYGLEIKGDYTQDGILAVQPCYGRIVTKVSGTDDADKKLVAAYEADKWYDFEVIVNLDANTYDVTASKDGSVIKTISGLEFTQDIKYLAWRTWGGSAYIDDLKVEVIEEADKIVPGLIPLNDDFESYTKFAGTKDSGDMSVVGYGKHVYGSNYAALETIDGDQALKIASGSDTVQYTLNEALTEGLVKIKYSGRFGSETSVLYGLEIKGSSAATADGVLAVQAHSGTTICTRHGGAGAANEVLVSNYTPNAWYDFEIIVNLDTKKYEVTVSKDGSVIKTLSDHDFCAPNNTAVNDIKYLAWRSWGNTAYIDDLQVEVVEETDKIVPGLIPLNDDFESYTKFAGTTDSGDMSVVGYGKHVYGSKYAALETIDGDQALKIASGCDTVQYTLNEALTEGLVRISYSGRFDSSSNIFGLEIKGDLYKDGILAVQTIHGRVVTKVQDTNDADKKLVDAYEADRWYDFEVIVNLDANTYNITASKDGNVVKTISGLEFNQDIKYLAWRAWGGSSYIDDLKVEVVEEADKIVPGIIPLNDGFETYTTVSGGSGKTDMVTVGYGRHLYSDLYGTLETVDGNKVMSLSAPNKKVDSIRYNIADEYAPTSGKVKVAFSARYDEGANVLGPEISDITTDAVLGVQAHSGTIVTKEAGSSGNAALTLLNSYTPDKWYDFVLILDLDNDTYDVQVSADGKVLNQLFDIALVCNDNRTLGINSVKYVSWRNWSGSGVGGDIDNLVIEQTEDEIIKVVETDILDDNFNSYATVSGGSGSTDMVSSGYGKHIYSDLYGTLETIDGDQAVRLSHPEGKVDSIQYALSPAADASGKIRITYSGRFDAQAKILGAEIKDSSNADGVLGIQVHDGMITTHDQDAGAPQYTLLSNYTAGEWYDFEIILDFENTIYSVAASKDGEEIGRLENLSLATMKGVNLSDVKYVAWRNWSANGVGGYIDDLKIEYYIVPPTISAAKINTIDVAGNETKGMTNTISPLTKQMILNFGSDLKAATLNGAVTLKPENETDPAVSFEGKVDGKYYIMTFDKMLKDGAKYILTVANTVTNVYEKTLGKTFTLNFSTGTSNSVAEIAGLYVGNTEHKTLDTLKAGDKLTVKTNYANATDDTASVVWIIAYYKGNMLSYTETVEEKDIPARQLGITSPEFTVADLTDITEVCVYLWEDINTIRPYCEPARLVYSAQN